jgi:hypothetical protein
MAINMPNCNISIDSTMGAVMVATIRGKIINENICHAGADTKNDN